MPYKDPIKRKKFKQAYYQEHKEAILLRAKNYNKSHKEELKKRRGG